MSPIIVLPATLFPNPTVPRTASEARATPELPCRVEEGPVTPVVRPANLRSTRV
jgi:hypothetical protein